MFEESDAVALTYMTKSVAWESSQTDLATRNNAGFCTYLSQLSDEEIKINVDLM